MNAEIKRTRSYLKKEVWLQRIQAAAESGLGDKQWCATNGIVYSTFKFNKYTLRKQGRIPPLDYAQGFEVPRQSGANVFTLRRPEWSTAIHFVVKPVQRSSWEQLYARIRSELQMNPQSGEIFLFVNQGHTTLYQYRGTPTGRSMTTSCFRKGTVPWPRVVNQEGTADITKVQLRKILDLVVVK